jgi:hypothetical protein
LVILQYVESHERNQMTIRENPDPYGEPEAKEEKKFGPVLKEL